MRIRPLVVATLILAAGTACGPRGLGRAAVEVSDIGSLAPDDLMAAAAVRTADVDTVHLTLDVGIEGGSGVMEDGFKVHGEGQIDVAAGRGRLVLAVPDGGMLGTPDEGTEMIFDGDRVLMKLGPAGSLFPTAKPWIAIDGGGLGGAGSLGALAPVSGGDPIKSLGGLQMMEDVRPVGTETVRGTETTHYAGEFSFDQVLGNPFAGFTGAGGALEGIGPITLDAWVDRDGLVRRFAMAMPMPDFAAELDLDEGGSGPQTLKVTMELFGFGDPVSITMPPESEIGSFTDLLDGAGLPDPSTPDF